MKKQIKRCCSNDPLQLDIASAFCLLYIYIYIYIYTSSTAQGGGGSFKKRNLQERLAVVMHGWQTESTDGPEGGWSCVFFGVVAIVAVVTSPTTAKCGVV